MAVNFFGREFLRVLFFECNAPIIQLERQKSRLSVHLTFDDVAEAKRYFAELETALQDGGEIHLSFFSEGWTTKQ